MRSFSGIFPGISQEIRNSAFSQSGHVSFGKDPYSLALTGNIKNTGIDLQITDFVMTGNPGYIIETLTVIPLDHSSDSLLNIYNALGKVSGLKGRLYYSETRNKLTPLFEEATRIASEKRTTPVADPAPASVLPSHDTVFLRLRDVNFGNTYYRSDISLLPYGMLYRLTNFRNINLLIIPVIKEGNFNAQLYFEPIKEGVLIFGIAGADISDFAASKIDMQSAIAKRLSVFISWAVDGIRLP